MQLKKRICDLCGGRIRKKDGGWGVLTVPDFKKADAKPDGSPEQNMMVRMSLFSFGPTEPTGKEFDVCRGCCEGLLMSALAAREKRDEFEKDEVPA